MLGLALTTYSKLVNDRFLVLVFTSSQMMLPTLRRHPSVGARHYLNTWNESQLLDSLRVGNLQKYNKKEQKGARGERL